MSYCVHCGVELDRTAKTCALCGTPVLDPSAGPPPDPDEADRPFSDQLLIPKQVMKKRFAAAVISVVLLIPNIVLLFVNLFFLNRTFWSVYVFSSTLLGWTFFVFPFFFRKAKPYLYWCLDTVSALLYAYVFWLMRSNAPRTVEAAFSVILLVSLAALVFILWYRRKKHSKTGIAIHVFADLTVVSLLAGLSAAQLLDKLDFFVIGVICSLCFAALFVFFVYCHKSRHMRAYLDKYFNV